MAVLWELDPADVVESAGLVAQVRVVAGSPGVMLARSAPTTGAVREIVDTRAILRLCCLSYDGLVAESAVPALPSVGFMTFVFGAPVGAFISETLSVRDDSMWSVWVYGDLSVGNVAEVWLGSVAVGGEVPNDGQWHVMTVVWDEATGVSLYLDGSLIDETLGAFSVPATTTLGLGAYSISSDSLVTTGTRLAVMRLESGALADPAAQASALLAEFGDITLLTGGVLGWTEPYGNGGMPITKTVVDLAVNTVSGVPELTSVDLLPDPGTGVIPTALDVFDFLGHSASGVAQVTSHNAMGASVPTSGVMF